MMKMTVGLTCLEYFTLGVETSSSRSKYKPVLCNAVNTFLYCGYQGRFDVYSNLILTMKL